MNLLRELRTSLNEFFYQHYPFISICCCFVSLLTAYLQYEWKVHNYDLMSWKQLSEACYATSTADIDFFQLCVLLTILCINVVFVGLIVAAYVHPLGQRRSTELTLLEIKDRFSRFILLRLIARLDRIQSKMSAKRKTLNFHQVARAHHSMVKAVAVFRKDARKLLLPNESEIMQPIEDIYGVADDEERALRREGYYKLTIDITDATVKSLFNAQ
ncbi:uncharacterized protein LOC132790281 [Drosophila nasuta]|uniref:Uncharacterized protein LOC117568612 n=1 Tax=Drosophila albomicans TaxID=7291 RepID=A0A6P8WSR6_DROAB|nr:uncharacterized protein LOC117568612 [Drosophila albomicans]XP_060654750.1 uncharacterized protein LOC132790281 [Drosophila nasuta]